MAAATPGGSGLIINATIDASITSRPDASTIEATINRGILIYESLFRDPITVNILFRYSSTLPNGAPMGNFLARSGFVFYRIPWGTYLGSLRADAKTSNDGTANASLPSTFLSSNIAASSANGRALGLNTPPAFLANGTIGNTGPYDGIVTLNVNFPFQFTRPVSAGNYDAQRAIEHEMDEVLGLGSHLGSSSPADLRPQDLFSWKGPGARNTTSTGVRYFSINGGRTNLVSFNQGPQGDFGDWLSLSCPQAAPRVQNAFGCTGQSSDISSGSPEGVNLDVIGYDLAPPVTPVGLLGNISTRLNVGTGEDVLIGGFIIDGSGPKQLVLRALGPTLSRFGVSGVLQDPILELHNFSGGIIASNDNWSQAPNAQSIPGYLQPTNGFESAILTTLNPGSYTAIVRGGNNSTGVALVELYDTALPASAHLRNISTRGLVQTDPDVMIAGMMVRANSKKLIVRALGPTLANFGVSNPLADPTLELHDENGAVIASNDNWKSTQQGEIAASGYAPANDLEAAIIQTVAPGNYTAIVRGVNSTGVALVEIYALQ